MSDEMSFGEMQQTTPERQRRPDQDPRWSVVAVGSPQDDPLPIFVHFETWRGIERSVAEDTSIELGGVLLGGHYVDEQDQPFVEVCDALEARHYEATKGSFKFTHDTWQDLLQRTAAYPTGTKMVGWYHSHPGWGIFLSEMDLFICQSFFTHPLDVALVVDPCQDQRGWFYWQVADAGQTKQRSRGFFLYDSRHRRPLLEQAAEQLIAAELSMNRGSLSQRSRPAAILGEGTPDGSGVVSPKVIVSQADATWPIVFLGMLVALQTVLIFVVAWMLMRPAAATSTGADAVYQGVIKSLIETSDPAGTPPVSQQRLETLLRDQQAVQTLRTQNQLLTAAGDATLREVRDLADQLEKSGTQLQQARALNRDLDARVQSLERAQAQAESAAQDTSGAVSATWGWVGGWSGWASYGLIGGLGAALGAAAAGWWFTSRVAPGLLDDEKG